VKALITGGCGFIGSHLANYLRRKGHEVLAVDIKPLRSSYLRLETSFRQADLRKFPSCLELTKGVNYVYHLAANMGGIGYITRVQAPIMRDNTLMNLNILEACRVNQVQRVFFSSSACVYPLYRQEQALVEGLRESDVYPANPNESYGWEKLYMEKLMEAYHKDYGLNVRIGRLHNIYGPHGPYKGGREKAPAALCRKVALAEDGGSVTVWGNGGQTRSFLYIDDCLRGVDMLMESDYDKPLNIGSDRLLTVDELAQIIIRISGKNLSLRHDLSKPQGVRGRNADLTLVRKILGWEPSIGLEEGLRRTYDWVCQEMGKC